MKRSPNPKVYFGLAGLTLIGGTAIVFFQNAALDSQRLEAHQLGKQAADQKAVYSKLDQSRHDLADLQTKLAHLERGVPDTAYVPTMLKELEDAGKQHSIEVLGVRPVAKKTNTLAKDAEVESKKPYEPLDVELKGRGSYSDIVSFVRALNVFPKIVAVRTVTIGPSAIKGAGDSQQGGGDGKLELTLNLRAFLFKENPSSDAAKGLPTQSPEKLAVAKTTQAGPAFGVQGNKAGSGSQPGSGFGVQGAKAGPGSRVQGSGQKTPVSQSAKAPGKVTAPGGAA